MKLYSNKDTNNFKTSHSHLTFVTFNKNNKAIKNYEKQNLCLWHIGHFGKGQVRHVGTHFDMHHPITTLKQIEHFQNCDFNIRKDKLGVILWNKETSVWGGPTKARPLHKIL